MTKRRLLRWSLILVTFAAFAVWLEPTRVVWGWLRGEAFYERRPTSWWERELARWEMATVHQFARWGDRPAPDFVAFERSRDDGWASIRNWIVKDEPKPGFDTRGPALLHGDPQAGEILRVLSENSDDLIRRLAKRGLEQIETHRNEASSP